MSLTALYEQVCATDSDIVDHLPRLYAEASTGDATVIELGVRTGVSTVAFLAAVEAHGGHVWSADINPPPAYEWTHHEQWSFLCGDDLELADSLPDNVDLLFIDTSHTYDQTCAELEMYADKVRPGGVILLHDVELKRPELSPWTDPPFPVRVAVDEFCEAHGLTVEIVSGCNGLGVIRMPEVSDG